MLFIYIKVGSKRYIKSSTLTFVQKFDALKFTNSMNSTFVKASLFKFKDKFAVSSDSSSPLFVGYKKNRFVETPWALYQTL